MNRITKVANTKKRMKDGQQRRSLLTKELL
jgi:hypothetical protein